MRSVIGKINSMSSKARMIHEEDGVAARRARVERINAIATRASGGTLRTGDKYSELKQHPAAAPIGHSERTELERRSRCVSVHAASQFTQSVN